MSNKGYRTFAWICLLAIFQYFTCTGILSVFTACVYNSICVLTVRKKATYDKFGEEGLKEGIPPEFGKTGAWSSKYIYHGNPQKTFRQFFGGDNPFAGEENKPYGECSCQISYLLHQL